MISTHLSHGRAVWLCCRNRINAAHLGLAMDILTEHAIKHISQEYGATKTQVQVC